MVNRFWTILVLLAVVGMAGCRTRQESVSVDGVTLKVAAGWTVERAQEKSTQARVRLRHIFPMFFGGGSVSMMENGAAHGGWTMDSAKVIQDRRMHMYQQLPSISVESFNVVAGRYTPVCVERKLETQLVMIGCEIAGSPLSFEYVGDAQVEPSVRAMLSGLE